MPQRLRLAIAGNAWADWGAANPLWNRSLPGDARVTDARLSVVDVRLNAGVADVRRRYGPLESALSSGDHQIELRPSGNAPAASPHAAAHRNINRTLTFRVVNSSRLDDATVAIRTAGGRLAAHALPGSHGPPDTVAADG